ncbi:MAG: hypothetical protein M3502_09960 [Actinomycetota bacterium]|nr:hypothetical protein [Actinomycetota bacterium]
MTGATVSTDFPTTAGAFDPDDNGADDPYVAKLDPSQSGAESLAYSRVCPDSSRCKCPQQTARQRRHPPARILGG